MSPEEAFAVELSIIKAIKSGGWWTPAEIATKTGDDRTSVDWGLWLLLAYGTAERRHLGSDEHGDLYAYRLREVA